eukprot:1155239-Pelagomonas_calceolata.AAC.3
MAIRIQAICKSMTTTNGKSMSVNGSTTRSISHFNGSITCPTSYVNGSTHLEHSQPEQLGDEQAETRNCTKENIASLPTLNA